MKVELLAPAGDLEKLKFAFHYGADAVYFAGKKFGLRANANNFTLEEIKEATDLSHSLNKRVYVTVNIIFHDEELEGLAEYLQSLDEIGVDAIIASDILVIKKAQELKLKLEVHVSTQASILNREAALFYKSLGATRLVLAREASQEDISDIKSSTNLELECFAHGAMCTSFSGRCVLSNYCTHRDSNRGGCAQICRWSLLDEAENTFSMAPKDLNLIEYIDKMIEVGVNSFKIEGRMRGIYYIATVILVYRRLIDATLNKTITPGLKKYYLAILNRCANRDSTPQFFHKLPGVEEQYFLGRDEYSNQDFLGLVLEYDATKKQVIVEERNYFKKGDVVEFFGPNIETFSYTIDKMYDEENNLIEVANHPGMLIKIPINKQLEKYDMMRIKVFDKQLFL